MRGYRARSAFDGERELPGGALVLVDDGRIAGVEPGGAAAPDGVEVTEFDGTLLPGLIDSHVHLCGDGSFQALDQLPELGPERLAGIVDDALRVQLAAGVTTVRDLGDFRWTVVERGSRPGDPRVLASGPPVTTVRGHCWNMGGGVLGEAGLRTAARERFDHGADVVKVMATGGMMTEGTDVLAAQFTEAELRALVETAHGFGLPVTAHVHAMAGVEAAVRAGVDGLEHVSGLTADGPQLPDDELLGLIRERGVLVGLTPGVLPDVQPPPRLQELMERLHLDPPRLVAHVRALMATGVRCLVGTDGGINPAKPHGLLPVALAEMGAEGFDPVDLLRLATSGNADGLGLTAETGRLRVGLAADLLVVDGDPLHDLTALQRVQAVIPSS